VVLEVGGGEVCQKGQREAEDVMLVLVKSLLKANGMMGMEGDYKPRGLEGGVRCEEDNSVEWEV